MYPLRFEPIYQYRMWGGRNLEHLLAAPLPDGPVGEAWILSDRDDHPSHVADGLLKGRTIGELMVHCPQQMMGRLAGRFRRFPLLLKFLDARQMLSVQVHPSDAHPDLLPPGESGKTEAWVVLEARAAGKPHLCGIEGGHHGRRSAGRAHERVRGGRPCILHSETWRWRVYSGWDGPRFGWRRGGVRSSAE
jgi:mannose-6-phosphate isomerase class I